MKIYLIIEDTERGIKVSSQPQVIPGHSSFFLYDQDVFRMESEHGTAILTFKAKEKTKWQPQLKDTI